MYIIGRSPGSGTASSKEGGEVDTGDLKSVIIPEGEASNSIHTSSLIDDLHASISLSGGIQGYILTNGLPRTLLESKSSSTK